MGHEHHHHEVSGKNLWWTIVLNTIITIAKEISGFISGTTAVISEFEKILKKIRKLLKGHTIHHVNIQPEFSIDDNKQIIHN